MTLNTNKAMKIPAIITVMVTVVILWSFIMYVDSGVLVSGTITSLDNKQIISHLEGGIVKKVLIKEGDEVNKNQALLVIENLSFNEKITKTKNIINSLEAKIARINAELTKQEFKVNKDDIDYLNEFDIYNRRRNKLNSEILVFNDRIEQNNTEILILSQGQELLLEEILVLEYEYKTSKKLEKLGASSGDEVANAKKAVIRAKNRLNEVKLNISKAKNNITRFKNEINLQKDSFLNKAQKELDESKQKLNKTKNEYNIVITREKRSILRAVDDGIVLRVFTPVAGMVVKGGEPIIEVVAKNTKTQVSAKVKIADRDKIWHNMDAQILISHWSLPSDPIAAFVADISADSVINEQNNEAYYKIIISPKDVDGIVYNKLIQGMVVQILLISGNHSIADYIINPMLKGSSSVMSEAIFTGNNYEKK